MKAIVYQSYGSADVLGWSCPPSEIQSRNEEQGDGVSGIIRHLGWILCVAVVVTGW
jgi:hypothetical protein